jgi:hypothetical protein
MKITRPIRALLAAALLLPFLPAHAADKAQEKAKGPDLTLEDVIFDAKYLKQMLGPKTLVAPAEKTGKIPTDAIGLANLDEKTQIFLLPDEAKKPELKSSFAPTYPQSLRLRRDPIKAKFLLFVGTDGSVKSLYCYETNDQIFALATADAVIKWRYKPAMIGNTPVPVIVPFEMDFAESLAALGAFKGPRGPMTSGNPAPPPAIGKPPGGGPR